MKNSEKWVCDGIPQDGKDYGTDGSHEPCENFGPNCLQCGLPKEAVQTKSSGKSGFPTKALVTTGATLAVLIVGGGGGFYLWKNFQGCPQGQEKINGACVATAPETEPHQEDYEQAVELINQGLSQTEDYQNLDTLRAAHQELETGLEQLEEIPEQTDVYIKAQKKLNEHEPKLGLIATQIGSEEEAQQKLASAEVMATEAKGKTPSADSQNLSQLETAKQEWENALNTLEAAPQNTLVSAEIETRSQEYQEQLNQLQARIKDANSVGVTSTPPSNPGRPVTTQPDPAPPTNPTPPVTTQPDPAPPTNPTPPNCQQEPKPEQCLW